MKQFELFSYALMIMEHHLDTLGHVNNATYLDLLEEARWDFLTQRGFGLEVIHALKIGPIVLDCHIKFLKELRLRQSIIIESQMLEYKNKTGVLRQDIFNEKDELCCQTNMTVGLFDMVSRKLIMPTPQFMNVLGLL